MSNRDRLTQDQTAEALDGTAFIHLLGALRASYRLKDFAAAAALVQAVGVAAEEAQHHPDVSLGWGSAGFVLSSHDVGGVTQRDLDLAGRIQQLADEAGAEAQDAPPSATTIAVDTVDESAIKDFWRVAFGYEERRDEDGDLELVDPAGVGPLIWFQRMQPPRLDRNRIHFDVYVAAVEAGKRVEAVLAAGGHLVTDEYAPRWWVLADIEGNEICICTSSD